MADPRSDRRPPLTRTGAPLREAIERAIRDDDAWQILELAIALWREVPRIELAILIDEIDRALVPGELLERAPSAAELAAAATARQRGALLHGLMSEPLAELPSRLAAVEGWRDPRVTRAVSDRLARPSRRARMTEEIFAAIEVLLSRSGDGRARRKLAIIAGAVPSWCEASVWHARLEAIVARIEERRKAAPEPDADQWAAEEAIVAWWSPRRGGLAWRVRMTPVERRFWDGVAAAPRDLERRQVLADALIEAGDERGELVVRACRGEELERARLVTAWLSEIASFVRIDRHLAFEGGLLDRVMLEGRRLTGLDHPAWRTVRALHLPYPEVFSVKQWPCDELPSLEEVGPLDAPHLFALLSSTRPTRVWRASAEWGDEAAPPEAREGRGAPSLRELTVSQARAGESGSLEGLAELLGGPVGARLRAFSLHHNSAAFGWWQKRLRDAGAALDELVVGRGTWGGNAWLRETRWKRGALTAELQRPAMRTDARWWLYARELLEEIDPDGITGEVVIESPERPTRFEAASLEALVRRRFPRATGARVTPNEQWER